MYSHKKKLNLEVNCWSEGFLFLFLGDDELIKNRGYEKCSELDINNCWKEEQNIMTYLMLWIVLNWVLDLAFLRERTLYSIIIFINQNFFAAIIII